MAIKKGGFTLPGESGYEKLTLELAERWGADVIRDSDGTKLSDEILNAGYDIYSTICIIRDHNEFAKAHPDQLQQSFLMTDPVVAKGSELKINVMEGFFAEQFRVNSSPEAMKYWQVYDRTENAPIDNADWQWCESCGCVTIKNAKPWHRYTVSFMAYRIWEEISMYNYTTNSWTGEHLYQIDPRHKETQDYLLDWMEKWCIEHPSTNVVRFTSMFYNFVWIWGSDIRNRNRFTDWASYDFTVSPLVLDLFKEKYGYALCAEDFINGGKLHVTHMPPTKEKLDYMEFINDFVIEFGKKLIDIVHKYGKKAYVFYDDSWVGIEPYNGRFHEFGFDGLIKCVFSGYEARLCAGVDVPTHELRLHPYLFPVGLGGAPTFKDDGDPSRDANMYWARVRRALMRQSVDRIGLGGYLHLVLEKPDFIDTIEDIADEFRAIRDLHKEGKPYTMPITVAVLHCWGKLRSWTLSGHFHETYMHDLIHINEALAGLPVNVKYISFDDIKNGVLDGVDAVINAGYMGDAWSGGDSWNDPQIVEKLTCWTANGGVFIGVNEPSAAYGGDVKLKMAHVLGVDIDDRSRVCHGKWAFEIQNECGISADAEGFKFKEGVYLTDGKAKVLSAKNDLPTFTVNGFENGFGIYMTSFELSDTSTRLLLDLLMKYTKKECRYYTDTPYAECAYYPDSGLIAIANTTDKDQSASVTIDGSKLTFELAPYQLICKKL